MKSWKQTASRQAIEKDIHASEKISPEERLLSTGELAHVPELDLHGMARDEAWFSVQNFFAEHIAMGVPVVKILHGYGRGILKQMLMEKLQKDRRVRAFRHSTVPGEMDVKIVVLLYEEPRPSSRS